MCKRYDEEIEELHEKVAELEGYVLASELELEQIADKRREDEAQRMARILQISGPALVPTPSAAVTPPPNPSATPRTEPVSYTHLDVYKRQGSGSWIPGESWKAP